MVVVVVMMVVMAPPIGMMMVMMVVMMTNNDQLRHLLTRFRGRRPPFINRLQKGDGIRNWLEQFRKGIGA
jgi:hypothetical protein